jgi:exo-beta-1,3-glucanase (GH17 family)/cellulose synthase/poly-beta-1,6-N-acetylglucosamine synthase-like glycosyltransferase
MSADPGHGSRRRPRRRTLYNAVCGLAVAALAATVNLLLWRASNPPLQAPPAPQRVAGLTYNAFQRHDDPRSGRLPKAEAIDADLRLLAGTTSRLRTYSAAEFPQLPALAARHGIELALGVWLDRRAENNEREIAAAIDAARQHANVKRVIAGNETRLHGVLSARELAAVLARLRAALRVPVSTAEPWHVWLREPALAAQVDFITVHLLPYWEGVPEHAALTEAMARYRQLRERFPGKPIVIGEIGWPSGGASIQAPRWSPELPISAPAEASPAAQARFVRAFLQHAADRGLDYYLLEAFDQPWKRAVEGPAGAHWGLRDAARQPKFAFSGPVDADPRWRTKAALSSAATLVFVPCLLLAFGTLGWAGRLVLALAFQAMASFAVVLALLPLADYLRTPDLAVMAVLLPALLLMGAILMVQVIEFAEMHWPRGLRRRAAPMPLAQGTARPDVSIHLACCNEPPEQVIAAIDSLMALDWPALELIVVDNNTADAARWRPVQAHVQTLQRSGPSDAASGRPRLRFFHLSSWPGYKAGALNFALQHTDARAQWVGVVDADYLVARDWLARLAGWLGAPGVVAVQAPQAHRGWHTQALGRMMNWEYEGFFRIGMHHRHERNAVIQHGTMTLVRTEALRAAGGWAEDCVCEDSELGLRLLAGGGRIVYVDQVFGTGLVPADFAAYAGQRTRWAQGAMQILRRHARRLFAPWSTTLSWAQRYHFVAGWLPWVGDAAHLVFSLAAMVWTVALLIAPGHVGAPIDLFALPLAVFFAARLVMTPLLYRRLVRCSTADIAGAAVAGMALSHAVARGVFAGLFGGPGVFRVTRRGGSSVPMGPMAAAAAMLRAVREEATLCAGLCVCALAVAWPADTPAARGGWILVLVLQALPYATTLACALVPLAAGWRRRIGGVGEAARAGRL